MGSSVSTLGKGDPRSAPRKFLARDEELLGSFQEHLLIADRLIDKNFAKAPVISPWLLRSSSIALCNGKFFITFFSSGVKSSMPALKSRHACSTYMVTGAFPILRYPFQDSSLPFPKLRHRCR